MDKPIAVIADKLTRAIDILRQLHDVREINGAKRRVITGSGQVFYIILDVNDIRGMTFSDLLSIPTAHNNPHYEEILSLVRTRIYK